MSILRRLAASGVALAVAASGAVALAPPAGANGDALWFGKIGEPLGSYGPNQAVRIWGDLSTKNSGCASDGVNDFVYPTSDVYIVVQGTAVGNLVDVTGKPPNTVVQYGSVFDDEIIGITTPAGHLQGGTYDVVFDTCQDGRFDLGEDALFPGVLTVTIPGDLPPPDMTLVDIKAAAYEEYESWKQTRQVVDGVWRLVNKALKNGCKGGNPTACALRYGNWFNPIQEQFSGLLLNQGQHYLGIYEDPPNLDFEAPVSLPAVTDGGDAISAEGAVAGALLDAVEAYKGAQVEGDRAWALVHARTARDLHVALEQSLAGTTEQLQALRALYGEGADAALEQAYALQNRLIGSGFDGAERRTLRENGLSSAAIVALEADVRASRAPAVRAVTVRDSIDRLLAAHTKTAVAAQQGAAGWQDIVATLEADPTTPDEHPTVTVGGPFEAVEGQPTTLSAAGSAGSVLSWDLDGDRDFDDATGTSPTATFAHDGATVVGVRADTGGRSTYGWGSVRVARSGEGPQVGAATPAEDLVRVRTGSSTTFAVTPSDDTGAPTTTWTVDGAPSGTGDAMVLDAPAEPATRTVVATVTDADGHTATRHWEVLVHREDLDGDGWTATTDCDDKIAVIHPARTEVLGTGIDEDCDPATPDAPLGGLTGSVHGWGYGGFGLPGAGTSGPDVTSPAPTVLPPTVRQVDAGDRGSYAVLADGTVASWGHDLFHQLGRGGVPSKPGPVLDEDGAALGGVVEVSAGHNHVLARRTDGTVVAWGDQRSAQLGDGSVTTARREPLDVLTGPGAPLTGIVDVESGATSSYALDSTGAVWAWGAVGCDGAGDDAPTAFATQIGGLTGVRSMAATGSIVFFVMDDGRLLSCGGDDGDVLGRPTGPDASAYVPLPVVGLGDGRVVDASLYGDAAVVAFEDGSVRMWGRNTNGALAPLGVDKDEPVHTPTPVVLPEGPPVVDVDNEGAPVTFATRADGSVLSWGGNLYGHAGVGLPAPEISTPTVVSFPGRVVVGMAVGSRNAYALTRPAQDPALELPLSWVEASAADATIGESAGGAVTVTLTVPVRSDVSLPWELRSADDETIAGGTAVVPAGATSVEVALPAMDDALDEDDTTLTFALTGSTLGVELARAQATVTVTDDDAPPTVTVTPGPVEEGSTTLTDAKVRFTLSAPSGKEVVAHYATSDGTATAGQDYVATAATLRFAPGETTDDVHLTVLGDVVPEGQEEFGISLGEVTNATAGPPAAVTVGDHDPVTVSVTAPDVVEGDTGTTPAAFVVELSPAVPGLQVDVPWTAVEPEFGDGDAAGDVEQDSGVAVLTAQAPSAPAVVDVVGDDAPEPSEAFTLALGTPTASDGRPVLVQRVETGWVLDDDPVAAPAWPFEGFFSPVRNAPAVNTVKAGSAVPLKFSLGGDRGLDVLAAGSPASAKVACGADATGPLQPITTADGTGLTYDPTSGRYKIVWKTEKAWAGTCRQLVLVLADGSTHRASFRLK